MGRNQVYCCICGAPFLESDQCDDQSDNWLSQVTILTTGRRTHNGVELSTYSVDTAQYAYALDSNSADVVPSHVLQFEASYDDHNRFPVTELGTAIEAFSVHPEGSPLYLAVHKLCYQLAERFIDSRAKPQGTFRMPPVGEISSVERLWEVLCRRLPGSFFPSQYILPDPYEYYGGRGCRNVYWEPDDDPGDAQLLESNPLEIPGLTESILGNLEPTTSERPKDSALETDGEPQHIAEFLVTAHSQDGCCEALANNQLFPWLWDLDTRLVRRKQQDASWDWDRLVRKLSQVKIHESHDATLSLPLGLKNRRRIWRCLEDARLDDVAKGILQPRP
ncbi:hypothetical protein GGR55DRAFT_402847 [Xylaria sp. FL0064]|nr:hypothetical protein GGR55DRAFT_402847 [Xylaria sp. FL0064]